MTANVYSRCGDVTTVRNVTATYEGEHPAGSGQNAITFCGPDGDKLTRFFLPFNADVPITTGVYKIELLPE